MRSKTLKFLSKVMCVVLLLTFFAEAPARALSFDSIKVNVAGQQVSVTPGQWISVKQGTQVTNYNVRYVDGKPVALESSQYMKLVFGDSAAVPAAKVNSDIQTSAPASSIQTSNEVVPAPQAAQAPSPVTSVSKTVAQAPAPEVTINVPAAAPSVTAAAPAAAAAPAPVSAQTPTSEVVAAPAAAADSAISESVMSGPKTTGTSWIKNELNGYGAQIKDSFTAGKTSGNEFGNNTYDAGKNVVTKVGEGVQGAGSKIGDLLQSAKDRIAAIFHRTPAAPSSSDEPNQAGQSSQSGQSGQTSQAGDDNSGQVSQSGDSGQAGQAAPAKLSLMDRIKNIFHPKAAATNSGTDENNTTSSTDDSSTQAAQSGDSAQAGQTGDSAKGGSMLNNIKDGVKKLAAKTGEDFQGGYASGKTMANEGFDNVKTSLKSGFSAKNLLMTAGITVGVDLAQQIMSGQKPSLKTALKTVCSAEFAGSVAGAVTGSAAGSFFVPFLSAIPVVGGVLSALAPTFGSVVGGSVGAYLAGDIKNGKFSLKDAFSHVDWIGVGGQTLGSVAGCMLGSFLGPVGTVIGGMVGGYLGNWAAHKLAGLFGLGQTSTGVVTVGTPTGGTATNYNAGAITIGGADTSSPATTDTTPSADQTAVTVSNAIPAAAAPTAAVTGTYASDLQQANDRYQQLYSLYQQMISQGRQQDAMTVAQEMNKAKAEYDTLVSQTSGS